jgi:hypothetical protein
MSEDKLSNHPVTEVDDSDLPHEENEVNDLSEQPMHVLRKIGKHLDPKSLVSLAQTNQQMKSQMTNLLEKAKHDKELQDFLKKEYIDLPEGYDEELDDFIFNWSLPEDPEWDPSKFDAIQVFLLNEGPVSVEITNDTTIDLVGPVTLLDFVNGVNNGLRREMEEKGHDDLMDILGDHHFPEYLKRDSESYYTLHYGS